MSKLNEILESGQFPNTHNFRVPQAWSHWKGGGRTHDGQRIKRAALPTGNSKRVGEIRAEMLKTHCADLNRK